MATATNVNRGVGLWRRVRQSSVGSLGRLVDKRNFTDFNIKLQSIGTYSDEDARDLFQSYYLAFPPEITKPTTPPDQQKGQGLDLGGFGSRDSGYRGEDPLVTQEEQRQQDALKEKLSALKKAD